MNEDVMANGLSEPSDRCEMRGCENKGKGPVTLCGDCRSALGGEGSLEAKRRVVEGLLTGDADMDAILGSFLGLAPAHTLAVYLYKHFSAVMNFVKSGGQSESEPIEERLVDVINYCLLLGKLVAMARRGEPSLLGDKEA